MDVIDVEDNALCSIRDLILKSDRGPFSTLQIRLLCVNYEFMAIINVLSFSKAIHDVLASFQSLRWFKLRLKSGKRVQTSYKEVENVL